MTQFQVSALNTLEFFACLSRRCVLRDTSLRAAPQHDDRRSLTYIRHAEERACSRLEAPTTVLVAAVALSLIGCAGPAAQLAAPAPHLTCAYTACGTDAPSLAKVTAANLQARADTVVIGAIQPQFNGSVLVWQATVGSRAYLCREGRDPGESGGVHYVDCRRTRDTGPMPASLKAFP